MEQIYGENFVSEYGSKIGAAMVMFTESAYTYYFLNLKKGDYHSIDSLGSYSIWIKDADEFRAVSINDEYFVGANSAVQVEGMSSRIECITDACTVLVAGVVDTLEDFKPEIRVRLRDEIKTVIKPWGHELWIPGDHKLYAFKEIYIKSGTKTSLQYHNFKTETNVLFKGEALLHYKKNSEVKNDSAGPDDIASVQLSAISSIVVNPGTVHRLEAISDILLYEVSTPFLDDVVRIQDDSGRKNGRIQPEHDQCQNSQSVS